MLIVDYSPDESGAESVKYHSDLSPEGIIEVFAIGRQNPIGFVGATPSHEDEAEQLTMDLRIRREDKTKSLAVFSELLRAR